MSLTAYFTGDVQSAYSSAVHETLERLNAGLIVVLNGLNARDAQLTPHANPAKWNTQQIVEHLLLTYRSTADLVQKRLDKQMPTKSKPSVAQRLSQFGLLTIGYFPPGRQAPDAVSPRLPACLRGGEELTRRIRDEVLALDRLLTEAATVFGERRFASHFVLGPLSVAQWRKFHLVHGRHHVKQIRQIRRDHSV